MMSPGPLLVVGMALLVGCTSHKGAEHVPPLAVDQQGFGQRLTAVSPAQVEETAEAERPAGQESSADPPLSEQALTETPNKPEPAQSGDRVTFRTVMAPTKKVQEPGVRLPGNELNPERDPRRDAFEKRHQGRMEQVERSDGN